MVPEIMKKEHREALARLERRIQWVEDTFSAPGALPPVQAPPAPYTSPDSTVSFKEALQDWVTMTEASARMGMALGIYPDNGDPSSDQENAVRAAIYAMCETGVIETTFDPEAQDDIVRWNPEADL